MIFSSPPSTLLALICCFGALGACTEVDIGDPHPVDRLNFPVSVTADPGGEFVWVSSGNFDLRYGGSGILAIDALTQQFVPSAAFQVGGFAGPVAFQTDDAGAATAAYVLSRDANALYWAQIDSSGQVPVASCVGGERSGEGILRCPQSQAISSAIVTDGTTVEALRVGLDPYAVHIRKRRIDAEPDLLLTGSQISGLLGTWSIGPTGEPSLVGNIDAVAGLFAFAEHPENGRIYAASKASSVIRVLQIRNPDPDEETDLKNPFVTLVDTIVIPEAIASDRARDLAISADGTRLYAAFRSPDSLVVIDISQDNGGIFKHEVLDKIPLSDDPAELVVTHGATPESELVYVSCFKANRVEVVDPLIGAVVDTIRTGLGPFGLDIIDNPTIGIRRLYVANFKSDSVGVIELDPTSPYYHTQIAEIR